MRTDLLLRQTRIHFPRLDVDQVEITPIEKGGSDRKFYRVRSSPDQTIILVKYSLDREENCHYVEIAQFLTDQGVRAPQIYFHDPAEGLIWIEDLGEKDLFGYRNESWLVRRSFYESALDEVGKLHRLSPDSWASIQTSLPGEFNSTLYRWEQSYFFENCLGRHFKLDEPTLTRLSGSPALTEIADKLAALPRVLIHRDFQSQNIIMRNSQAYLIDFQGMRPGLGQYDIASLLYDPYVDLTDTERSKLIAYYCQRQSENDAPVDNEFESILRLCAMQRLMQALGAYGFLGLVKGHGQFLQHVPAALDSLRRIIKTIRGLGDLEEVLAKVA